MNTYPIRGIRAYPLPEARNFPELKQSGVYLIASPTMKMYFGQSKNMYKRMLQYLNQKAKGQTALARSFKKHGIENHTFCVVSHCPVERLSNTEEFYIKFYGTWKTGLNLTTGGGHYQISEETREKKRQLLLKNNPMRGKTHTDEVKKKLSEISRNMSMESRMKAAQARVGKKFSQETIEKRRVKLMGHPVSDAVKEQLRQLRSKPVHQYDLNGTLLNVYPSVKVARLETGVFNISHCAIGKQKQAGGFVWKYINDIK
jgi:group I intron endonuclease